MEMGEFSSFRRPLLIVLPIGFVLIIRFVEEFLAVRALGILCLLAAEPLLESAFFRYETSRLFLTVLAYFLIIAGLFWVTMPYLLRDQINWSSRTNTRWHAVHGIAALKQSNDPGLAGLAAKIDREEAYHRMHAQMWFDRLGEEPRLAVALEELRPLVEARGEHTPEFLELWEEMTSVRRSLAGATW